MGRIIKSRELVAIILLTVIGLFITAFFNVLNLKIVALMVMIDLCLISIVFLKPFIRLSRLEMIFVYCLISLTFLNNAFISIRVGFFSLFPYRIFLLIVGGVFIISYVMFKNYRGLWKQFEVKGILTFLIFWVTYSLLSIIWSESTNDAIKYNALLGMGIFIIFILVIYFNQIRHFINFYYIWFFMSLILMGIGYWNHFTLQQLQSSSLYYGPAYKQHYPTSVFYNQNDFATFLSISFFLFVSLVKNEKHILLRVIALLAAIMSIHLIWLTDSRASLLGVLLGLWVYLFILLGKNIRKIYFAISAFGFAAIVILFRSKIIEKLSEILIGSKSLTEIQLSSNEIRVNLLRNAMHYTLNSLGFGVGAGNAEYYVKNYQYFDTENVINLHNWLIEILVNYGLVIFCGYIFFYIYSMIVLFKYYMKKLDNNHKMIIEALICGMVAFLGSSISPSSVSNLYYHWVLLAFVIAFINYIRINFSEELNHMKNSNVVTPVNY